MISFQSISLLLLLSSVYAAPTSLDSHLRRQATGVPGVSSDVPSSLMDLVGQVMQTWSGASCGSECREFFGWKGQHLGANSWGQVLIQEDPRPFQGSASFPQPISSPSASAGRTTATRSSSANLPPSTLSVDQLNPFASPNVIPSSNPLVVPNSGPEITIPFELGPTALTSAIIPQASLPLALGDDTDPGADNAQGLVGNNNGNNRNNNDGTDTDNRPDVVVAPNRGNTNNNNDNTPNARPPASDNTDNDRNQDNNNNNRNPDNNRDADNGRNAQNDRNNQAGNGNNQAGNGNNRNAADNNRDQPGQNRPGRFRRPPAQPQRDRPQPGNNGNRGNQNRVATGQAADNKPGANDQAGGRGDQNRFANGQGKGRGRGRKQAKQ